MSLLNSSDCTAEDTFDRKHDAFIRRRVGGVVDGIGENPGLLRLAVLIDPQEGMAEHRGWIIHERRRKYQRERLRVEFGIPRLEPFAALGREAVRAKGEPF